MLKDSNTLLNLNYFNINKKRLKQDKILIYKCYIIPAFKLSNRIHHSKNHSNSVKVSTVYQVAQLHKLNVTLFLYIL